MEFLLTRPSRDVTRLCKFCSSSFSISTHTPLAGRDQNRQGDLISCDISTHTPLAGRDASSTAAAAASTFLLTRPSRDVTGMVSITGRYVGRFLLTRPSRDVTPIHYTLPFCDIFLLTRPSRDVTATFCSINVHVHHNIERRTFLYYFSPYFLHIF